LTWKMSTAPSAKSIALVVGTSLLSAAAIAAAVTAIHWTRYGARRRRRHWWTHKNRDNDDDDDDDIAYANKAQILELRRRYFSKSNSVSYENTGPLMIVKV
jgi:hypothetical protein